MKELKELFPGVKFIFYYKFGGGKYLPFEMFFFSFDECIFFSLNKHSFFFSFHESNIHINQFSDGSGSHAEYRVADATNVDQSTIFISSFCSVRIIGKNTYLSTYMLFFLRFDEHLY